MLTSESITNIAKALAAAQGEMKNPEANEEVKVYAKKESGGALLYSYKYATLPKCFDAVRVPFLKNGLSHSAAVVLGEKGADLVVRITHESGEWYQASVPLRGGADDKSRAGEITFWKRYLFNGLAGIAGDDDIKEENGERGPPKECKPDGKQASSRSAAAPKAGPSTSAPKAPPPAASTNQVSKPTNVSSSPEGTFHERTRGVIVKEIMEAAAKLGLDKMDDPEAKPDPMPALAKIGHEMFKKELQHLTELELEQLLRKLNNDMRGK